jgi:hypothetical protein
MAKRVTDTGVLVLGTHFPTPTGGYVTTADGRLLLFSMLANNWTVPVRDIEQVQDAVAIRLAQLRLGAR